MARYGYARVSSTDQDCALQEAQLREEGCKEAQVATTTRRAYQCGAQGRTNPYERGRPVMRPEQRGWAKRLSSTSNWHRRRPWRQRSRRLLGGSGVSREAPAPFCERPEVKLLRPTRHRLHYVRDVSFREDDSRIRCNPGTFARLRSFAANILRFNSVHNMSNGRYCIAVGGVDAMLSLRAM